MISNIEEKHDVCGPYLAFKCLYTVNEAAVPAMTNSLTHPGGVISHAQGINYAEFIGHDCRG